MKKINRLTLSRCIIAPNGIQNSVQYGNLKTICYIIPAVGVTVMITLHGPSFVEVFVVYLMVVF